MPGNYDIDYVDGSLTVTALDFTDWISGYPGLADEEMDGDPDGDGIVNLIEYFCGLDPGQGSAPNWESGIDGADLVFTYRRAKGIGGVSGEVRWSESLGGGSWSSAGVMADEPVNEGSHWRITTRIARGSAVRKFVRLEVNTTP